VQLEDHPIAGRQVEGPQSDGDEQAPGDRFRDVVLAKRAHALVERLPHEQHQDPHGGGEKRADENDTFRLQLDHAARAGTATLVMRVALGGTNRGSGSHERELRDTSPVARESPGCLRDSGATARAETSAGPAMSNGHPDEANGLADRFVSGKGRNDRAPAVSSAQTDRGYTRCDEEMPRCA
jgi:hypothetical protein